MGQATADEKSVRLHENGVRTLWDLLRVRGVNPAVGFNSFCGNVRSLITTICFYCHVKLVADSNISKSKMTVLSLLSSRYCPQNVCKLQSSYICGDFKNQTKNNEAYI